MPHYLLHLLLSIAWHPVALPAASQAAGDLHDFHVSRLTVDVQADQDRLALTLLTFHDDLELALGQFHKLPEAAGDEHSLSVADLNIGSTTEHPAVDSLLGAYLQDRLQLYSKDAEVPLRQVYLGHEPAEDPYGLYLYAWVPVDAAASIVIEQKFLLELYEDQQNIVLWREPGQQPTHELLTARKRRAAFDLP